MDSSLKLKPQRALLWNMTTFVHWHAGFHMNSGCYYIFVLAFNFCDNHAQWSWPTWRTVSFVFTSSNYCCFWLDCNNTERPSMITCMHAHTNSCDDVVMQPIMVRFINTILLTACEFIWLIWKINSRSGVCTLEIKFVHGFTLLVNAKLGGWWKRRAHGPPVINQATPPGPSHPVHRCSQDFFKRGGVRGGHRYLLNR